ncbi:MAG: heavy-metal-associated domain-containing protein [Bacteroidales bacterium]|nr:heavy-metal-associated domain-containing protein [Candidatus Cryptobacteroides fimicaballi]
MKKLALTFAIVLLAFSTAFAGSKKDIRTVTFDTFLHCKECVRKVQENIAFEKGVKGLDVSLEKQRIVIDYDSAKTSPEALKKAIEKLGYKAIEHKAGKDGGKD